MRRIRKLSMLVFIMVLSAGSGFAQDDHVYSDQKIKTIEDYYIVVGNGVDWVWGMECLVDDFTPSGTAQIAPGSGDPGFRNGIILESSCPFPALEDQVAFAFNVKFVSLAQIGTWTVTCHGYGAVPVLCTTTYEGCEVCYGCIHDGCSMTCDQEVVYEMSNNVIFHITAWNYPPSASITHSPTPAWNNTVTLRANASDPDGGSLSYTWSIIQRPPNSTKNLSTSSTANPTISFNSETDIGTWGFQLHVDDDEGERKTFSHQFTVPNVPPNITINGATSIDALSPIDLQVTPTTDVDGGNLAIVWDIEQSPSASILAPQNDFCATNPAFCSVDHSVVIIPTTENEIGTWRFRVTATDNEGDTDTETITVVVNNLPPEIDLNGNREIDVGESIRIETNIIEDADGGDLIFRWDIIQVPQSAGIFPQEGFSGGSGGAGYYIEIPTNYSDAGTWIIRLVARDNEGAEASEEFTVLVDAPAEANISGSDTIGSLSSPLILDGSGSLDPDSPCPERIDRCHDTLDGRPVTGISPGIDWYNSYWSLIDVALSDVSSESRGAYPLGGVDEVLGIPAHNATLDIGFGVLEAGVWTFQLEVIDGEGNRDFTTHTVTVIDANGPPVAVINGPARYTTDPLGNLSQDILLSGYWSYDLDNLLVGDPFGPGLGIADYRWTVNAPPGCTAPSLPSGSDQHTVILYNSGVFVDPICHGIWNIQLTVTDDDSPAKTDNAKTTLIIGNCLGMICIDSPTTQFPEFVEFTDNTDIFIYYHLDSVLYDDPIFASGLVTILEIFHESDLNTPVYTSYDPSVLASDKGGFLLYHWNGYSNTYHRPQPGQYTVKVTLLNSAFSVTPFTDVEAEAIWISVAEPSILPTSDKFIDFDPLDAPVPTDTIDINYSINGSAVPDQVRWRVRDAAGTEIFVHTEVPRNSISWDGKVSGSTLPAGIYTIEVELLRTGNILGTSDPFYFLVYQMSLIPATGIYPGPVVMVPDQLVLVNDDDDNSNGTVDLSDSGPLAGEDDLQEIALQFKPTGLPVKLASILRLTAHSGGANVKLWDTASKANEILLDAVYDLMSDSPPAQFFVEGIATGDTELRLALEDAATAAEVSHKAVTIHVHNIDIDVDSDMNGTIDVADDAVEMNDHAIIVYVNNDDDGGSGNDAVNNAIIENAADKAELTTMILRQNTNLPAGSILRLSVSDKNKIRIFDHNDNAIIGPPAADGGPDIAQHDIPLADIAARDLTFRIECVHGGLQTISLVLYDSTMVEIARDELKVALNVHRQPGNAYATVRNRVNLKQAVIDLEGLKATLAGAKPIVSWDPNPPQVKTTSFWISIQHMNINNWLQTGVRAIRSTAGVDTEELYFEFVPNYPNFQNGTDPLGYQVFAKAGEGWTVGDFQVEITNRLTGEAKAFHGGAAWRTATHTDFIAAVFHNYQMGTEPKQTVSRVPGSPTSKARISAAEYKDPAGWHVTAFNAADITISSTNGRGVVNTASAVAPNTSASLDNMNYNWVNGQEYEIWDDRN